MAQTWRHSWQGGQREPRQLGLRRGGKGWAPRWSHGGTGQARPGQAGQAGQRSPKTLNLSQRTDVRGGERESERARERERGRVSGDGVIPPRSAPLPAHSRGRGGRAGGRDVGRQGLRLWRSVDRLRRGSSAGAAAASRDPSSYSSSAVVWSVAPGWASSGAAVGGALARDACWRQSAGVVQQQALKGVIALAQQRMGIFTRSECLRATSDSDNYTPGPQKEPLLRPKEIDVEDESDDEPLEEDGGEIVSDTEPRELSSLELELQNAPRRKQRFILQKALKIRNMETEGRPRKQGFTMKVVDVNRTCKVTKGGGILNFTALVICGNGDGVAGYGKGKSAEVSAAVDKAYARALRNLHYFERFDGHTIFHEKHSKYGQTKIYLWPALSGTGMRASHTVGGILRLAGFKNVKSKVVGSRHPHNTVKAVFQALSEIETPQEAAEREGRQRVTHHA